MWRWVRNGESRAIDIGWYWRIAPEDLDHFLCPHAAEPRPEAPDPGCDGDEQESKHERLKRNRSWQT